MGNTHVPDLYRDAAAKAGGLSAALEERDAPTQEHCDRVSGLCLELGQACGLSRRELGLLRLAAGLHDVGKIGIPDEVLKKADLFDANDWLIMKTHCARGERIVQAAGLADGAVIAAVVRHHHERYDGGGYPDGIAGETIPLLARIVAVVDAYDAMAYVRPHAIGRPHRAIMRELQREDGGQHDPALLARFASVIERSSFKVNGSH